MSIPAVRARLYELAKELGVPELHSLADQTIRRKAQRRAPTRSPTVDAEMAQEIRDYATANPDLHLQDIAEHFGVNHGRVTVSLNNER